VISFLEASEPFEYNLAITLFTVNVEDLSALISKSINFTSCAHLTTVMLANGVNDNVASASTHFIVLNVISDGVISLTAESSEVSST